MKKLIQILSVVLSLVILTTAFAMVYFRQALRPSVLSMAYNKATTLATATVNECVLNRINSQEAENYIKISYDDDGNVVSLSADTVKTNALKARLSVDIADALSKLNGEMLKIPLGNVINGYFFSGRGANIKVKIINVGAVKTELSTVFEHGAINQSLYRLVLDVSIRISMYVPFSVSDADVTTSIIIAESLLVGDVPQAYTYVVEDGDSSLAGTLNDYGAQIQ